MQRLVGKPVSPGYAKGIAVIREPHRELEVPRRRIPPSQVVGEHERLHDALLRSCTELERVQQRVLSELGQTQAAIFSGHLALLRDQQFVEKVKGRIQRELINVEQALEAEVSDLAALLADVENEYLRERAQDIRDVGRRVLLSLCQQTGGVFANLPDRAIIVASELLPSETIDLARDKLVAIVTELGGETSHAAILARSLGVPAVTGVSRATTYIANGAELLVDGATGEVTVAPSQAAVRQFSDRREAYNQIVSAAVAAEAEQCVTRDGTTIHLYGNLGRTYEVDQVRRHHLGGVGLFRTEFMFLEEREPPTYERHREVYSQVADALGPLPLVIRTFDLGGDKVPGFLSFESGASASLGLRGLRFSLAEETLFRDQLRAIVESAAGRDIRVLFPMVVGADDLRQGIEILREVQQEAGLASKLPVGAMIETPSALFALDEILDLADFVSIGTNDLTQYMLAADRNAMELIDQRSALHPSVLRAIARVLEAARAKGRPACVCGEAAGEARTACLLVGLGARELSMSPVRSARVRYALRSVRLKDAAGLAEEALGCHSADEVTRALEKFRLDHV